jgi:putative cell wall-binding protein
MRKARKSLAILLAVAMVFCMAPAMVFGAGDDGQVNRIAGNDRYITSAETALRAFESTDTVLIARGDDEGGFADGLAASYLAGVENAPILLTEPNGLPPVVKDAISKLGAKKAIILGGPAVVSDKVKDDLAGLEVERIFGDDRFETAAKIAAKGKADTAFVVSGYAPADSLVAGPLAFSKNYPILLVGNNVPDFTSKALADLGIKNIYVIGGTGVVSESVYNDLAAKADQIVRYGGNDRVATSLEVAQNLYTNPVNFSIVGYDGLADAVGAAVFGNPILYTDSDLGISGIQSYLAGAVTADSNVNIFGGTGVVSNAAETALENIVPDELKVEIVSAIDVNKIEVTFNTEVTEEEQEAAVFSLKRGAANFNIASVEWSEDGTKAVVTSALANLNTSATDTVTYNLTVTGLTEEAVVETVDFAPVEETELVITTEEIELKANAPLKFEVRNQYGKSMNIAGTDANLTALAYNITKAKAHTLTGQATSEFKFDATFANTGSPLPAEAAEVGDEIRVTLTYKDFTVQQVLIVGEAVPAAAAADITLGTVSPKEGKTVIFESDTSFEIPYDIVDQFGEEYTLTASSANPAAIETADGVTITSSNTTVLPLANISTDAEGKLQISGFGGAGKVTVTAMINSTGDIATTTIDVKADAVMSNVTIVPPTEVVAANDGTVKLDYVAEDQYGNVLDWSKAADKVLIQAGFNVANNKTSDATVVSGMALNADGELVVTLAGAAGEVTLKATDGATEEFGSVTFEVLADAVLTSIAGVKDLTTKVSEGVATDIAKENLVINDQYGRDYTLATTEGALVYFKSGSSTALAITGVTGADIDNAGVVDATTGKATITGTATSGSSTLVIALVTNTADTSTAVAGGTYEVTITNETDVAGYSIEDVDVLFGDATHTTAVAAGDYAKTLKVVGLDADGNEVAVDQSKITAITTSNSSVIGTDLVSKKVFALDKGSATVAVWIGAEKVAETVVTAVDEAPAAQTVKFANATGTISTDGGTLDLGATLEVKDQYGVALTGAGAPANLGVWSVTGPTGTTVSTAGVVTASSAATGNGEAVVTFVLNNGNAAGTVTVTITNQAD